MTNGRRVPSLRTSIVSFAVLWVAPAIFAAEPAIRNLNVRGLQVGGTTTLVIDGDDLGTAPRLLLPFAAKQEPKQGGTDKKATIDVTLGEEVTPGYHHLRIVTDGGVSLPVVIGVDSLPQKELSPKTADKGSLAVHGVVAGSATVEASFQGKAKQKVMVEVEAQRLGSKLRPVAHLYSPKKIQLAWSWAAPALFGDTRLEATLPEDGIYTITLHDSEYAAAAGSFFRLKIGAWAFVDQVFPPVVSVNKTQAVELLGPAAPVSMKVATPKDAEVMPLAWPKGGAWSGPRPFVRVSDHAEFVQQAMADGKLQEIPEGRVGVSGRLLKPNGEDRYRVAVTPGRKIKLEVFAERYGSPLDTALVVRNEKGDQLARAEDSPGTLDPVLEYTAPANVNAIVVGVVDAQGRGGPRGVYRLVIDPQTPAAEQQAFKVFTTAQRLSLPAGGKTVIPVFVDRRGYQGKIDVATALQLPMGLRLDGGEIPAGADGTLVTVERGDAPFNPVITHWRGRGADGGEQTVTLKGHPLARLQPWLATEIALAPTSSKAADFVIDWRDLPADIALKPASKLSLPVKLTRANPKTTVKLTLLTSQSTPIVNNQPDPNKALRPEKAVELPVNAATGDFVVLVPPDLSAASYDVSLQADFLAPDKKVLATSYAPVRRLAVRHPLIVRLAAGNRIEAPYDPKKGATVKVQGKLERAEGFKNDAAITILGLPPGVKADTATLKAAATDFTVNVTFPPNVAAGEIKGLKLTASAVADPKTPNVRVRSREVEVVVVLQAAK